ncbi:unnamed protein product [Paramecium pentaurelia]|uniref:CCZ1/INTU/HSP4 first Longin domain-containing protein n=1 Tax=Paramecium pentaurelia TaxID=43138 RepID=A0A8S1SGG6_9CILI|nr:unnamed protein product [Paramecium pentaurelia]
MNQDHLQFDFQLKALFMFNPLAVPTVPKPSEQDQQDAKLIYYFPQNANIEEKRIQTGMAEGIFIFFKQFNPNEQMMQKQWQQDDKENELKFQTIHLESQTHIICQIREDLFLFMTIAHQKIPKVKVIVEDYFFSECNKFHYSLSKNLYTNVAENFINNFSLFYGFDISQLDQYTWRWIQCNARTSSQLNLFYFQTQSFKYAFDASIFLLLQFLLSMIRQIESQITDFLVFYNGYFVYSTLPHKMALLIKEHYYGNGLSWSTTEQKVAQKQFLSYEQSQLAYLNFNNLKNLPKDSSFSPQIIYLNQQKKYFFTFLEKQFFVILISDITKDLSNMTTVTTALLKNVDKISSKLESYIETNQKQDSIRYIYFNGINLASKISSQLNIQKLSQENLRILQQVYEKLNHCNQYVIRNAGMWFFGIKVVDKRVIYLQSATISLSKIEEEINKFVEQLFPNFLL